MTKLGKFALSTSITLVGGWALANLVIRLPVEMPGFLDNGIRAVLRLTDIANSRIRTTWKCWR